MRIAVIPARGGSKRIPRKNIKSFFGKPMLAWSIEKAKESCLFDRIFVSTDDQEIAEIALKYGAEVPFIRPEELSDDITGPTKVLAHAVKWALAQGLKLEAVCCIYATAPFIEVEDLKEGYRLLSSGDWAFSFPATPFSAPIFRSFKILSDGSAEMFFPEYFNTRSQDLPPAFHDCGQFYWGKPESWLEEKIVFASHSVPLIIPKWRVQDIDDENDWTRAEILAETFLRYKNIHKLRD